jgi:hypothetical protein
MSDVQRGEMFWNMRGVDVLLLPEQGSERDEFICVFDRTWDRIPAVSRDYLRNHWQGKSVVILLKMRGEMPPNTVPPGVPACCYEREDTFFFVQEDFLNLPCHDWRELLIAHELAHVYLFASGDPTHLLPWPEDDERRKEWHAGKEIAVHEVLRGWGFNIDQHFEIEDWAKSTDWGSHEPRGTT